MKKVLSLSAAIFTMAIAFAQDTIPPPLKKNFPDSTTMDSMRTNKNMDTSSLNKNDKWPDTSMNRNRPDTTPSAMTQPEKTSQNENTSQSDSASSSDKTIADRVIMKDDKIFVVKNGDSTILEDSIKLESGAIVTKDGTVSYTSGKAAKLKNGQYVSLGASADNNSQTDSTSASATQSTDEDKVIMVGDKVFVVKHGDSTVLTDSIKLKSGALVKSDATVLFKDGTNTTLKNGQYIALNPAPAPTPPAENKVPADSSSAAETTSAKPVVEDKVVMKDDQVVVIKNGDSTVLEDSITLGSGAVVKKDGSVIFKNGKTTQLKNGQFIGLNSPAAESKKTKKAKKKMNHKS